MAASNISVVEENVQGEYFTSRLLGRRCGTSPPRARFIENREEFFRCQEGLDWFGSKLDSEYKNTDTQSKNQKPRGTFFFGPSSKLVRA